MRTADFAILVALAGCAFACTSGIPTGVSDHYPPAAAGVKYSLVYVIHGDGDYLYHDSQGKPHQADQEALSEALEVGERSTDAEVFIFHQIPKKRFLFFASDDGEFWYYRRGTCLLTDTYSRNEPDLREEARLYAAHASAAGRHYFLYFGHEIPETDGTGYDESSPDRSFDVSSLARALRAFTQTGSGSPQPFDLLVLSTCYNGSPCTLTRLAPYARYVIASPENLHLSYIDSRLFGAADSLDAHGVGGFARRVCAEAFGRLEQNTETAITVVLYDMHKLAPFLNGVTTQCDSLVGLLQTGAGRAGVEYYDWMDSPVLYHQGAETGVTVFYRPPQFGRMKMRQHHSGWEAWRALE